MLKLVVDNADVLFKPGTDSAARQEKPGISAPAKAAESNPRLPFAEKAPPKKE